MAPTKDWSIEELGELVLGLQLFRSPADMASSLGRNERDVESKIAELGLLGTPLRDEHSDGQKQIPSRRTKKTEISIVEYSERSQGARQEKAL